MSKTAVVFTCSHADPRVSNNRFSWLGDFIFDIKPDYVVDLGDGADMRSLNTYDTRYPESVVLQSYEQDINYYNDAQERLRWKFKAQKKKKPAWFGFEGNHENRIKKAISTDPRLEGTNYGISFNHLNTNDWFTEYHEYSNSAPAIYNYDGIDYAHFIAAGNYGTAMSGEHHAFNLLKKRMRSVTVGHSHKRNVYFRDDAKAIGLVAGCYKGAPESWAGQANDEWASGVVVKRNIDNGYYDFQWVSIEALEREYGR